MVPTLQVGERVLVNRIGQRVGEPHVGDIVVFHPPEGAESGAGSQCGGRQRVGRALREADAEQGQGQLHQARSSAGPGDRISIRQGRVIRNGKLQKEPFISDTCRNNEGTGCTYDTPITIPPGHWFMMGDNRGESDDSRFWGPIPESWIIGGAFATYWPPKRIGLL